ALGKVPARVVGNPRTVRGSPGPYNLACACVARTRNQGGRPMASTGSKQRGFGLVAWLGLIAILAVLSFASYIWLMFSWSYARGERAGWVQKLSEKGYVCKTWEGEMAMVTMPGSIPEKF